MLRMDTAQGARAALGRSEEHTSELQSQSNLVCRLLLEKKKRELLRTARNISRINHRSRPNHTAHMFGRHQRTRQAVQHHMWCTQHDPTRTPSPRLSSTL